MAQDGSLRGDEAAARALVASAASEHAGNPSTRAPALRAQDRSLARARAQRRERAHGDFAVQRGQIAGLLGRIRALEQDLPEGGIQ